MNGLTMMAALASVDETASSATSQKAWDVVTDGTVEFISNVLNPCLELVTGNEICLMFLSVTFVGLGIKGVSRLTKALGRGR